MSPTNCTPWTFAECAKLITACGDRRIPRKDWMAIVAGLGTGRTVAACKQQLQKLRRNEGGPVVRRKRREVVNIRRVEMQEPPAAHAMPRHASLTAAFFGDPLPGRSALDQRQSA